MTQFSGEAVIAAISSVLGGVGFWNYLITKKKRRQEHQDRYLISLISRVEALSQRVEILISDKEELLREVAGLKTELATANAELTYLRNMLIGKGIGS